jgi:hypothetical protein
VSFVPEQRHDLRQIKLAQSSWPHGAVRLVTEPGPDACNRLQSMNNDNLPLTAFRRGTIDDAMLDQQMAAINDEHRQAEEALQALQKQLHGLPS